MAVVGLFATLFILGFAFDVFEFGPDEPDEPIEDYDDPVITPVDPVVAPADPVVAPADPVVAPADPAVAPADPVVDPPIDLNNIIGTEGDDTLSSNGDRTTITGLAGNDLISGGAGNQEIYGGLGNDYITNIGGNNVVSGGEGNDTLLGGNDSDNLFGEEGEDSLLGNAGADGLYGGRGEDTLSGEAGNDFLHGGYRPASLGSVTNITPVDSIEDDLERDILSGGDGNDVIFLGSGDLASGGAGSDRFHVMDNQTFPHSEITDFNPSEDILTLELDRDPNDVQLINDPVVTLTNNGSDAEIFADGRLLTVVKGAAGQITLNDVVVNRGLTVSI